MSEPYAPTRTDPLAAHLSDRIGGPAPARGRQHWWWTPVRVVLACCTLLFVFGTVQRVPCMNTDWNDTSVRYAKMCYSDVPYLYTGRGFAEHQWPYSDSSRYTAMEYPVGISVFAWGVSIATALYPQGPSDNVRAAADKDSLWGMAGMAGEINEYFVITLLLLFACALGASYLLATADPRRAWDALPFAATPVLPLAGLVNWDLLAVVAVAGALWAWARGRPLLTGVCIGLGTAIKLYPLFLLGALLVIALRNRDGDDRDRRVGLARFAGAAGAAALSWLVVNAPIYLESPERWRYFWHFNSARGADLGSWWLVLQHNGHSASVHTINLVSWVLFGVACLAVLALGLRAPKRPTLAQLGFLIVAAFLIVNKVYSPQYVLWLLPLAVLARPRWRDQAIWQGCELVYFAAVWIYLGGWLAGSSGSADPAYTAAIAIRTAGEIYLAVMIVRDLWSADLDPVEGRGRVADPGVDLGADVGHARALG